MVRSLQATEFSELLKCGDSHVCTVRADAQSFHIACTYQGTYNNEWLIIDYERFADGKPGPGTLTVVDQIPGFVATEDVTYMLLQQGCE